MKSTKPILPQQAKQFEKIKVRLDAKTVVTINRISSLEKWKMIYPEAEIIH
jgi:hypothetical protein